MPFHLTTIEALSEVERVLAGDGVYAANLIDHDPLAFARAEVATLGRVFGHVALAADRATAAGRGGGNLVALASDAPLHADRWREHLAARDVDWVVLDGARLERWVGEARTLTDNYAPVDQLLTPY